MSKSNVTLYTTPTACAQASTKVHQSLLALLMLVPLLLTPACSPDDPTEADDPPSTRPTTTTTAEPTTTTTRAEDAVREAYGDFVEMLERIMTTTVDPNDPELAMRMIDPALSGFRSRLSTWQAEGLVWIAGDQTRHRVERVVVSRDRLSAEVTDCVVGNDALVRVGTTSVQFPLPRTDRGVTTMVNQNGHWLVTDTDPAGHWEGIDGCAG